MILSISVKTNRQTLIYLVFNYYEGLACGRGTNLSDDTGFIDRRFISSEEVLLLRPMREFSDEEIHFYNQFSLKSNTNIFETLGYNSKTENNDSIDSLYSIQHLTRHFLVGLQENFPATIPTIFRTGDKMNRNEDKNITEKSAKSCVICHGRRDALGTTLEATNFSRLVSCKGKEEFEKDINIAVDTLKNMDINAMELDKKGICKPL